MNKFFKNKKFIVGSIISIFFLMMALVGLWFTPWDPNAMSSTLKFASPSFQHILGCDNFGRDIFSRLMTGLSKTLLIAVGTNVIGILFGIIVGALTGYFGGVIDTVLMRFNDAVLAFPSILLALLFISIFGPGQYNVMFALGIVFIPSYARIIRGEYLVCRNMDYVRSAKIMGASNIRIMFVHIFPNVYKIILTTAVIGLNNAILAEAGLSFLGIGVQPPDSSLGSMLSDSQTYIFSHPSYAFFVGFFMVLMIIGFAVLSDGIKEVVEK